MSIENGKNIGLLLLKSVPEYKSKFDQKEVEGYFEIGSYLFFNEFSENLGKEIAENINSEFVTNAMRFINDLSYNEDEEVINLLKIGILEILYTSGFKIRELVLGLLNEKNREHFKYFEKYYY